MALGTPVTPSPSASAPPSGTNSTTSTNVNCDIIVPANPLSAPGLAAGAILIFVPVIGSFMEPRILGGKAGFVLGNVIEDQFTVVFNWPLGAALSFILLAIVLLILAACYPLLRGNLQGLA